MSWYAEILYALAYACAKAWFDAQRDSLRAIEEVPTARDRAHAENFADALERSDLAGVRVVGAGQPGADGSHDTTQIIKAR